MSLPLYTTSNPLRAYKPLFVSGGYDTSIAATLIWRGAAGTATAGIASTTLTLIDPTNGTSTFDMSNASYNTFGELKDAVEAKAGWECKLVGASRARFTYSSNLKVNTFSTADAQTATNPNGVNITLDATNALAMVACVGREADSALPAQVRQGLRHQNLFAEREINWVSNPVDVLAMLKVVRANGTFGSGAATFNVIIATQAADIATLISAAAGGATTVDGVLDEVIFGTGGLITNPGERIIIEYVQDTTAFTAGSIRIVNGGYGEPC